MRLSNSHFRPPLPEVAGPSPGNVLQEKDQRLVFLSIKDAAERDCLSERTVYNLVESSDFPKPVRLTGNRIAFVEAEVEDWMRSKIAERDGDE